jgi:hypothetical protein
MSTPIHSKSTTSMTGARAANNLSVCIVMAIGEAAAPLR